MKKNLIAPLVTLTALLVATSAQAQLGDLLKHGDKVLKGAKVARAATAEFTPEQELEIGKIVAGKVLYNYPAVANDRLQTYVRLIGETLVPYSERSNQQWHFAVIDAKDVVNAFSTPGNFVFVTSAAIRQMKSEAELANVLGHEIAHVDKKHILNEIKKGNIFSAGLDFATDGRGGLSGELAKKVADMTWEKLITKGLGRKEELEADAVGAKIASSAGYRSEAMSTFLETLDQGMEKNKGGMSQFTATHPPNKDRIAALKPIVSKDGATLDDRFKRYTAAK
jgi:predicted Zn-dependent protease